MARQLHRALPPRRNRVYALPVQNLVPRLSDGDGGDCAALHAAVVAERGTHDARHVGDLARVRVCRAAPACRCGRGVCGAAESAGVRALAPRCANYARGAARRLPRQALGPHRD